MLFAVPCVLAQTASQAVPTSLVPLPDQIATILASPAVARDHWGITVTALDGTPIYSLNDAQLFHPASNAKLFTTAAALALLGPDRRFTTTVQASAPMGKDGVLHGDLTLVGGGDADFGTHDVPYVSHPAKNSPQERTLADIDDLADQLVKRGLRSVDGDLVADDQLFSGSQYPDGWSVDDLLWGYAAPVSALSVHDNQIDFTIVPSPRSTSDPDPQLRYYSVIDLFGYSDNPKDTCASILYSAQPGSKELTIQGSLYNRSKPCTEHIAIDDPAEYAALQLKQALEYRGVRISGSAKSQHDYAPEPDADIIIGDALAGVPEQACPALAVNAARSNVIAQHSSPTLAEDVMFTNKASQNLHAEIMLRNIATLACNGSALAARRSVRTFLTSHVGIDPSDFVFYDGSGLSTKDLVTPRAIARLLSYAAHDPKTVLPQQWFEGWKSSLPIGGVDGSLEHRFTQPPLKGHIFAKTGTLGESRALSGYVDCASGHTVIFSILIDNHLPGTTADRDAMDRIVAAIQASN